MPAAKCAAWLALFWCKFFKLPEPNSPRVVVMVQRFSSHSKTETPKRDQPENGKHFHFFLIFFFSSAQHFHSSETIVFGENNVMTLFFLFFFFERRFYFAALNQQMRTHSVCVPRGGNFEIACYFLTVGVFRTEQQFWVEIKSNPWRTDSSGRRDWSSKWDLRTT